jgi:hypothetical protein
MVPMGVLFNCKPPSRLANCEGLIECQEDVDSHEGQRTQQNDAMTVISQHIRRMRSRYGPIEQEI